MDPRAQLVLRPVLTLVVAVLVGVVVGWWASTVIEPVPFARPEDDEWTGLLFVLALIELPETPQVIGGVVGVLVGGVVWAVGLLWVARRLLPHGQQGAPVLATLATAWLGTAVVLLLWGATRGDQGPPALAAVTLVAAVIALASCAVFPVVAHRRAGAGAEEEAATAHGPESIEALGGWLDRAQETQPRDP